MHQWIVLLHVAGAFLFVIAHGVSMWMAIQVSRETDRRRIAALLDLSSASLGILYIGLVALLVGGIWAAIDGDFFSRGWPWAALVLLVLIAVAMYAIATPFFRRLREAVGVQPTTGEAATSPQASDEDVAALARQTPVMPLAVIGFGGLLIILWLMVLKPF
jgi:ABC-type xylose transport system permease subunit